MTPSQLAKSGTEAGHQMAVMCWAQVAEQYGFACAWLFDETGAVDKAASVPVPELKWLHAIANGGSRGDSEQSRAIRGGQLKAQGVKAGVSDLMLPVKCLSNSVLIGSYSGLYIEMKKPGNLSKVTAEQKEFGAFVQQQGFAFVVCDNWRNACKAIEAYLSGKFGNL